MTFLEEIGRQPHHVADEIAHDLEAREMTEHPQRPSAQRLDRRLDDDQSAERERQNHQKILVGVEYRFVDHKLDLERRREGGDLQNCRKRDHLGERASHASHLRPQTLQPDRGRGAHRTKAGRRRRLERDAGEMLGDISEGKYPHADGGSWITALGAEGVQDDQMVEVPMPSPASAPSRARQARPAVAGSGAAGPRSHQAAQRDPSHRQGKALARPFRSTSWP